MRRSLAARNWMLLALLVLAISGSRIAMRPSREVAVDPYFRFLQSVERFVPPGSSYTTIARDPDTAMAVLMLSYGVLPDRVAMPSTYFGVDRSEGEQATYILAYGSRAPSDEGVRVIARVPLGSVYQRQPR